MTADITYPGTIVRCTEDGCDHEIGCYGGVLTHHDDGSHTLRYVTTPSE